MKKILIVWSKKFFEWTWSVLYKNIWLKADIVSHKDLAIVYREAPYILVDKNELDLDSYKSAFILCPEVKSTIWFSILILVLEFYKINVFQWKHIRKYISKSSFYMDLYRIWLWKRVIQSELVLTENLMSKFNQEDIIEKPEMWFWGRWVRILFNNKKSDFNSNYLYQKRIQNNWDVRVLFLKGHWCYWYSRVSNDWKIQNNVSMWWTISKFKIPKWMRDEVEFISKKLGIKYFWIDYVYDIKYDHWYIFEINLMPWNKWIRELYWVNIYEKLAYYI